MYPPELANNSATLHCTPLIDPVRADAYLPDNSLPLHLYVVVCVAFRDLDAVAVVGSNAGHLSLVSWATSHLSSCCQHKDVVTISGPTPAPSEKKKNVQNLEP